MNKQIKNITGEKCHIEFHVKYGYRYNNLEQMDFFINNNKEK